MVFLFGGFRNPRTRPRFIIWTGIGVLAAATVMIVALGATSTYWFCANVCHKVQDDTIIAYNRSTHDKISCMACHEPVNAPPWVFVMAKAEALGELYLTATNQYELPLNGDSHVSEEMPSEQCTQCHAMQNRNVTPTSGIIINHEVHAEENIKCPECHNRVAHREDFELTLKNPDGTPNKKHMNFMTMDGCFRCHSQEPGGRAPGDCYLCHPKNFSLKPGNHLAPGFYEKFGDSSGHWKLYNQDPEYCKTCHSKQFCTNCHGVEMPHPDDFVKKHGPAGRKNPKVCANCHAGSAGAAKGLRFCNECHHPDGNPNLPWIPQHWGVVDKTGAEPCFDCHNPAFCPECHVSGGVAP